MRVHESGELPLSEAERRIAAVIADPATTYWLKSALKSSLGRDPVDAVDDAEALHELLNARTGALLYETVDAVDGAQLAGR